MLSSFFIGIAGAFTVAMLLSACCLDSEVWIPFFIICMVSGLGIFAFGKAAEWAEDRDL